MPKLAFICFIQQKRKRKKNDKKKKRWDVPSGPVVKTPRFHCRRLGFHPPAAEVGELRFHMQSGQQKKKRLPCWLVQRKNAPSSFLFHWAPLG